MTADVVAAFPAAELVESADVVLQAPPTMGNSTLDDAFLRGEWYEGLALPFTSLLGPVAGVLVAIVFGVVMLEWSDTMAIPVVLGILVGGYLISFLPPAAQVVAYLGLLFGGALALYNLWNGGGARPR
jgi:hypothetical protein